MWIMYPVRANNQVTFECYRKLQGYLFSCIDTCPLKSVKFLNLLSRSACVMLCIRTSESLVVMELIVYTYVQVQGKICNFTISRDHSNKK